MTHYIYEGEKAYNKLCAQLGFKGGCYLQTENSGHRKKFVQIKNILVTESGEQPLKKKVTEIPREAYYKDGLAINALSKDWRKCASWNQ